MPFPFMKGSTKKDKCGFWVGKRKMRKYEREGKPLYFQELDYVAVVEG